MIDWRRWEKDGAIVARFLELRQVCIVIMARFEPSPCEVHTGAELASKQCGSAVLRKKPWAQRERSAMQDGQAKARSSHPCAAFHRRGKAVVPPFHSVCASVPGASILRLPGASLTARTHSENLIERLYTLMLLNTCLQARHNSRPAHVLHLVAYQKFSPTGADLLHRQNQGYQQSEAANLFVVVDLNRRGRKYCLRLLLETD